MPAAAQTRAYLLLASSGRQNRHQAPARRQLPDGVLDMCAPAALVERRIHDDPVEAAARETEKIALLDLMAFRSQHFTAQLRGLDADRSVLGHEIGQIAGPRAGLQAPVLGTDFRKLDGTGRECGGRR